MVRAGACAQLWPIHEQTVAGVRRLLALGQRVKVNGVLTRHLLDTLPGFARLMAELLPEEVGLDTVKPTAAFEEGRERYADLCPPLKLKQRATSFL